jgi:hypothetical protein
MLDVEVNAIRRNTALSLRRDRRACAFKWRNVLIPRAGSTLSVEMTVRPQWRCDKPEQSPGNGEVTDVAPPLPAS